MGFVASGVGGAGPLADWTYALAKDWLASQGGTSFVMEFNDRPVVVVAAWGLSTQVVVERNSVNAEHDAFVEAARALWRKL